MPNNTFFPYLLLMAGTTYLVRAIPFVAISKKIENRFIRSFLYYIPYAVLTAMTIPAIFSATSFVLSAIVGMLVAVFLSYRGKGLTVVALSACVAVFLCECVLRLA
ncbi:MAG: AzlD domain-containing protein [Lachnospiraceae bacterium]|nr:AzlD domain-containing protein [Lachnospiraceae bacterium]